MSIIKLGLSGAAVAALAILLIMDHRATQELRRENQILRQQIAQHADLRQANQPLLGPQAQAGDPAALPEDEFRELLKLRGEDGRLRQQAQPENRRSGSVPAHSSVNPTAPPAQPLDVDLPMESWAFAGHADPQSAFQSFLWASTTRDARKMLESRIPGAKEEAKTPADEQRMVEVIDGNVSKWTGVRLIAQQMPAEDQIVYTVNIRYAAGTESTIKMCMKRIGSEWKYNGEHAADWNP
jgi:hypothetical protein